MSESIYLDYMASTPVDPQVMDAMQHAMTVYANPSSLHPAGLEAASLIEQARVQVAQAIQAEPRCLVWTSGATESNNLAIRGAVQFYQRQGKHIITMQSEHKAVSQVMSTLEKDGFEVTYLAPLANGLIDCAALQKALRPDTILVSVMWVNNETGVIHPIAEIAKQVKKQGALLHVDAAQALGKVDINSQQIPFDLLTLAAHKYYGPKGVGALFIRQQPLVRLQSQLAGSGQEGGLRPGTVPTHQVVGMGAACAFIHNQEKECQRIQALKNQLLVRLKQLPGIGFYGEDAPTVPHCIPIYVDDISMAALLARLSDLMIATGSACNSATPEPSSVLLSMGVPTRQADNSCRISLGRFTTAAEIDRVIQRVDEEVRYLRAVSPDLTDRVEARMPYLHAYEMQAATHQADWASVTEGVSLRLYARVVDQSVQELSFLLKGGPAWFALLNDFCSQFAGNTRDQLQCLGTETLMQALRVDSTQMHLIHALLASINQLGTHERTSL
jgi:cysteine desulfurase